MLHEIDQETPFGGLIGTANSGLHEYLKWSKIMRLHAVFHDAAGYMRKRFEIGPGYTYAPFSWGYGRRKSPLAGHLTGVIYCLFLKIKEWRLFWKLEL